MLCFYARKPKAPHSIHSIMSDNSHRPLILIKCVMGVAFETKHKHFIMSKTKLALSSCPDEKKSVFTCYFGSHSAWIQFNENGKRVQTMKKKEEKLIHSTAAHNSIFYWWNHIYYQQCNNRHLFLEIVVCTFSVEFFFVSMIAHTVSTFLNMHCHHRKKW